MSVISCITTLTWYECVEIVSFITLMWSILRWLNRDIDAPLIIWACMSWGIAALSWIAGFEAITLLCVYIAPIAIVTFMLFHKETLQRNYLVSPSISEARDIPHFIEEMVRYMLYNFNRDVSSYWIIEHENALEGIVTSQQTLHAPLRATLMDLIITSHRRSETLRLWVTSLNKIVGLNPEIEIHWEEHLMSPEYMKLPLEIQKALILTMKTDAIIIYAHSSTRTCTLIAQGKYTERIAPQMLIETITKLLQATHKKEEREEKRRWQSTPPIPPHSFDQPSHG
jgi:uncharacterized membrane protein